MTELAKLVAELRSCKVKVLLVRGEPIVKATRSALAESETKELVRLLKAANRDALVKLLRSEQEISIPLEDAQTRWIRRYGSQRPQFGNEFSPAARGILQRRGRLAAGLEPGGIDFEEAISRRR